VHDDLHWLDVPQRVTYKLCLLVFKCLHVHGVTPVSCRAMCTGRRRHAAPQAAFYHSRTTGYSSVQHEKLRPTGILIRRPSCLELTARTSATIYFNRPFHVLTQDVFIRADRPIEFSALETSIYLVNGLYKFVYLLTYLLTYLQFRLRYILPPTIGHPSA